MSNLHDSYFRILDAAFSGLMQHPDKFIRLCFERYKLAVNLLQLKTRGMGGANFNSETGLPLRADMQKLQADVTGDSPPVSRPAADIADEFLEIMLRRKKVPSDLEIELMARAIYCEEIARVRQDNDLNDVWGVNPASTLRTRLTNSTSGIQLAANWDAWPINEASCTSFVIEFQMAFPPDRQGASKLRKELTKPVEGTMAKSPNLLKLAAEIDDVVTDGQPKLIKYLRLAKLYSADFGSADDGIGGILQQFGEPEDRWVLEFETRELKSVGTLMPNPQLKAKDAPLEQFYIDTSSANCVEHGCSYMDRHLLVSHKVFEQLKKLPSEENCIFHVLNGNTLTANF